MGEFGLVTRVLPDRFDSTWTYAGGERQVGQVPASTLLDEYRYRTLTGASQLYGIVGLPVAHSVSPAMHNAAFAAAGLDAVYLPLPAVDAGDFVGFARRFGRQRGQRDDAAQSGARRVDGRGADAGSRGGRHQHYSRRRRPVDRREYRRGGLPRRRCANVLARRDCGRRSWAPAARRGRSRRRSRRAAAAVTVHARHRTRPRTSPAWRADVGPYPPQAGSWDLLVNATPVGMYPLGRRDARWRRPR